MEDLLIFLRNLQFIGIDLLSRLSLTLQVIGLLALWLVDINSLRYHCSMLFLVCISNYSYEHSSKIEIYLQSIDLSNSDVAFLITSKNIQTCWQASFLVTRRQLPPARSKWIGYARCRVRFTTELESQWYNALVDQIWLM